MATTTAAASVFARSTYLRTYSMQQQPQKLFEILDYIIRLIFTRFSASSFEASSNYSVKATIYIENVSECVRLWERTLFEFGWY